ncbi:hypothetical protein L6452_30676 [Arctium lappa]|uniref:Uncharacterized protein n=1 Tax=Arctium lappa TaxID=4217 RepID=A0ACB8ZJ15_ARCLA|nr:hypothetical protein L6452_30676 [Arctium lappa]
MEDIGLTDGLGVTLMSDQHKGLVEAVKEVFPLAEHRQCARHIYANFRKKYTENGASIGVLLQMEGIFLKQMKAIDAGNEANACSKSATKKPQKKIPNHQQTQTFAESIL